MATSKKKELLIGDAMLGAGLGYLFLTSALPRHSGVDAAFVPFLLSAMLCLLGALQLVTSLTAAQAEPASPAVPSADEETPVSKPDLKTTFKTLALIVGYIALLKPVGFPIMTVIYLYLQFLVLSPIGHKINHIAYALIALISSATIYLLFREAFDLMLPSGLLGF